MADQSIVIDDITIAVTRKRVKRLNLRVHPPDGRVTVSAPRSVPLHAVKSFAAAQVDWIRRHRERIAEREKERPPEPTDAELRVRLKQHKAILNEVLPPLIQVWEQRLSVGASGYSLRRMKTRWGSCNPRSKRIRLNTELAAKPIHLLEYVLLHELVHLRVPNHGPRFVALMDQHYPAWRQARKELNGIPRTIEPAGHVAPQ